MKGYFRNKDLIICYDDGSRTGEAVLAFGYLSGGKVVSQEIFRGREAEDTYRILTNHKRRRAGIANEVKL